MFVRFRKLPCDGFRPKAASFEAAYIACRNPWREAPCRGHCRMKPRCRWRIGRDEQLAPYRLKVVLVENKRVNGKVKQETIAVLGSIEATWLLEFWAGIDKKAAAKLKADDWELYSLRARTAFWKGVNRRLKQLENRLGPDKKRIRRSVNERVPWPMLPERERLELLEAKNEYDFARGMVDSHQHSIATDKKFIKRAQKNLAETEALGRFWNLEGAKAAGKLAKLSARGRP